MRVVVDASVAVAWFLPETTERKAMATALLTRLREQDGVVVVPDIFHYEVAVILRKSLASKTLQRAQYDTALAVLRDVSLETHGMRVDVEALCNQAARFGCQVRDSAYVELARAEGLELATLDGGMLQAARAAKLKVWRI